MRTPYVLALAEVGRSDLTVAGGKAVGLGALVRLGERVPPGFVVTTAAYATHLAAAGPNLEPGAGPDARRAHVEDAAVPADVRAAVLEAYAALGGGPVAVRSSATAEDLPGAAFAGQQDTYLDVAGPDAVVTAVRRCWGSLTTPRAVAYRQRRGVDEAGVQIAVVVQRMVDPELAGVLFTANPLTGARDESVVDAAPGLGEALVSGLVTPEHLVLDARGRVLEHRVPAGATTTLPAAVAAGLVALGRRVAADAGAPQDLEWAWADDILWVLQARPLTALPPPPLRLGRLRRTAGAIFAELLPVRPYPLDMSTWTTLGHGRILVRMARDILGVEIDLAAMLPEVDGVVEQLVPADPRPTWRTPLTPLRMLPRVRRSRVEDWQGDPRLAAYEETVAQLDALDVTTLGWTDLLAVPRRSLAALDGLIDLRVDHLPGAGLALARLGAHLLVLGLGGRFGDLITGARTRTSDANDALRALAAVVAGRPAWRQAFLDDTPADDLALAVVREQRFAGLRGPWEAFLDEYGHRETTSAFLMSEPTWRDHPAVLVAAVRGLLAAPGSVAGPRGAAGAEAALLELRRARLTGSARRLRREVAAARAAVAFREDTHFHAMRAQPVLRRALLEAGARLARAGVLEHTADVLHLRLPELEQLPDPAALAAEDAAAVRRLVAARAGRRAALAAAPLVSPLTLRRPSPPGDALVRGTPASGGMASGAVRVVREPAEFARLRPGEVLVCPYTNPSWTPLFGVAAAVVVDTGGMGSHAAIVTREYGIPAVMGTVDGTRVLADGQRVVVDGTRGEVRA